MIADSQCLKCKWFWKKDLTGNKCDAFPKGIPGDIWFNRHSHTFSYKGDKGILFKEK